MARETKVGLIVGLAFIICFAVILANRGQPTSPPSPSSYQVDSGVATERMIRGAGHSATTVDVAADGPATHRWPQPVYRTQDWSATPGETPPGGHGLPPGLPTSGGEVLLADGSRSATGWQPSASLADEPRAVPVRSYEAAGAASTTAMPYFSQPGTGFSGSPSPALDRQKELEQRLRQLERVVQPFATGAPQRGDAVVGALSDLPSADSVVPGAPHLSREKSGDRARTYSVVPGDTLYKIAQAQYGSKATRVVDALVDANRDVLRDRNRLQVGTVLTLPPIEGSAATPTEPAAKTVFISTADVAKTAPLTGRPSTDAVAGATPKDGKGTKRVRPVVAEAARPSQWYQVRKNDRYASIAREVLGDAGRWREIYELNKDKFPHPSRIREGVRIKLPAAARTDGRTRT